MSWEITISGRKAMNWSRLFAALEALGVKEYVTL